MHRAQKWIAPSSAKPPAPVVLVHGLWMPPLAMTLLARRLAGQHFAPRIFTYQGRGDLCRSVRALLLQLGSIDQPFYLVAHSLGGLLALEALHADPGLPISGAVLLASPVLGCLAGRNLAVHAAGRWLLGDSARLWHERTEARWNCEAPLGVIAGTAPWGLGRLLWSLPGPNDGVVCLEETLVKGMSDRLVVQISHSGMLFSPTVAAQVGAFLRRGRFLRQ